MSIEELCNDLPVEFKEYFNYCRSLQFKDRPDYYYLKRMFQDLYQREEFEFDGLFDWDVKKLQENEEKLAVAQQEVNKCEKNDDVLIVGC